MTKVIFITTDAKITLAKIYYHYVVENYELHYKIMDDYDFSIAVKPSKIKTYN